MGLVYDPLNNVCQVVWLKEAPTRFPIRLDGAFVHFKCFVLSCNLDAQMNYIYDLLYEIKTSVVTVTICVSKLPDETSVYVAERQIPRHIGENVLSYPRTQVYMENFATATPHIRYLVDRINYVLPLFRVLNE